MRAQRLLLALFIVLAVVLGIVFLGGPGGDEDTGGGNDSAMTQPGLAPALGGPDSRAPVPLNGADSGAVRIGAELPAGEGRVVNEGGAPVSDASIWLGEDPMPFLVTGPDGRFPLAPAFAGGRTEVVVAVHAENYLPFEGQLGAGRPARLVLRRGAVLELQLVGKHGQELNAKARLKLRSGNVEREVTTGGNGFLRTSGWLTAPVEVHWNQTPVAVSPELENGKPTRIEVRLPRYQQNKVVGRVVSGERPVVGARVYRTQDAFETEPALTDEDGRFEIPILDVDLAVLVAEAEGLAPGARRLEPKHLKGGEEVVIELRPGLDIPGRVLTRHGEDPVVDAEVTVTTSLTLQGEKEKEGGRPAVHRWSMKRRTDAAGEFRAMALPQDAVTHFRALVDTARSSKEVRNPGDSNPVVLWIDAPPVIVGRVTDPAGNPITDARLCFRQKYRQHRVGYGRNKWTVDSDGRFRMPVPAKFREPFFVASTAPGMLPEGVQVDVATPGVEIELNVVLRPNSAGHITGRIRDAQGNPIYRVRIRARPVGTELLWGTKTDPFGRFRFRNLPRGTYELFVDQPEEGLEVGEVVARTGTDSLELTLAGRRLLEGVVVAPAGWSEGPLIGEGTVFWEDQSSFFWITDSKGGFVFEGPPPGTQFYLVVRPVGLAAGMGGPFVSPALDDSIVFEVEADRGLRIEGELVMPEGMTLDPDSIRGSGGFNYDRGNMRNHRWNVDLIPGPGKGFVLPHVPPGVDLRVIIQAKDLDGQNYSGNANLPIGGNFISVPMKKVARRSRRLAVSPDEEALLDFGPGNVGEGEDY